MKSRNWLVTLTLLLGASLTSQAQDVALKTNLLGWASTTPNLGLEFGVGRKSTLQVFGDVNLWEFGEDKHFRVWTVMPEYRFWFCEKFGGSFIGIHALGGQYNAKNVNFPLRSLIIMSDVTPTPDAEGVADPSSAEKGWPDLTSAANKGRHAEGWYAGGGITYGYQWILSKHWNLEASLGVGYVYSRMDFYGRCNRSIDKRELHYVGPTKAALSLMYIF